MYLLNKGNHNSFFFSFKKQHHPSASQQKPQLGVAIHPRLCRLVKHFLCFFTVFRAHSHIYAGFPWEPVPRNSWTGLKGSQAGLRCPQASSLSCVILHCSAIVTGRDNQGEGHPHDVCGLERSTAKIDFFRARARASKCHCKKSSGPIPILSDTAEAASFSSPCAPDSTHLLTRT